MTTHSASVLWESVCRKHSNQAWAASWVDLTEALFSDHITAYPGAPSMASTNWSHYYYCDDCAEPLEFDLKMPKKHRCLSCGRIYSDSQKDGAWHTWLHGRIMRNVERAAILARVKSTPEAYVSYLRETLLFYARHYRDYPVHGEHVGKGRVLPQSLDEAIWIISAGRFLQWGQGAGWFSESELDFIRDGLFLPALELLKPQISKIHNIHVWLNSAVATCAFWLNDDKMLRWTIEGDYGWRKQLESGVNGDGFWWEGSIHYHFYSFQAFASLVLTAADGGLVLWDHNLLKKMLSAPLDLAFADGRLPAHNDCWQGNLYDWAKAYELGSCVWPEAGYGSALSHIYRHSSPGAIISWTDASAGPSEGKSQFVRNSAAALLYGPENLPEPVSPRSGSRLFKASGIGILENDQVRICMRAGPDGGKHDHHDKLNIDIVTANGWVSDDLGSSGYGAEINQRWYKQPAAHNIPVVNQQPQKGVDATLLDFTAERMAGQVEDTDSGIVMSREIRLTPLGWTDSCRIEAMEIGQLDWCFHGRGKLISSLSMKPIASAGTSGGFDWLKDVSAAFCDGDWWVEWQWENGSVRLCFNAEQGTEVLLALAEGNPTKEELGVVVVRRQAASTVFEVEAEIR